MSSRSRKDRGAPSGSEEQQLWDNVRSHLKVIESLRSSSIQDVHLLDERRKRYLQESIAINATGSEHETLKGEINDMYKGLDERFETEQGDITKALEKLEVLIALREESNGGSKRKKRKTTDQSESISSSTSPPPVLTANASERKSSPLLITEEPPKSASSIVAPTPEREKKRLNSKSNANAAAPPSSAPVSSRRGTLSNQTSREALNTGSSSATNASNVGKDTSKDLSSASNPSSHIDPARARREVLAHQLPLKTGRKVAFRQPSKSKVGPGAANVSHMTSRSASAATGSSAAQAAAAAAAAEDEGETWIMATIIECINNDRNRYVVQDAEDTAMPTYNTTLKAIVPLPESLATLPLEDYKKGTLVMGLYPDTSCFYQATVIGGGPGLSGKVTVKMQRRADEILNTPYELEFEDDNGAIQLVPACLIVEKP